jgi:hypothetical protein
VVPGLSPQPPNGVDARPPSTTSAAAVLAEVRGCIAALANESPYKVSVVDEQLLLLVDAIHGDDVPALEPVEGGPDEVWVRLVLAMDRLVDLRSTM